MIVVATEFSLSRVGTLEFWRAGSLGGWIFLRCFSGDGGCGFLRLFWCIGILDTSVDPKKWLQNMFERHLIWCSTNHSISPYFSKIDKSLYQNFSLVVLVPAKCGNSIPTYQNRFTCFLEMQQWGFYCARAPCQRRSVTCHVGPNAGRSGRLKGREVSFKSWNTSQNMLGFTGITWEFFWGG